MPTLLGRISSIKPLLGRLKTLQSGNSRGQIDVLPFWIEAGRLQLVHPTEKLIDKACNTMIARRSGAPVKRGENVGHRDGGDPLALGDKVGIVRRLQIRGEIVILEFRTVFDRQEFETRLPFSLHERVDRLRSHKHDAGNLTALQLLERYRVRNKHLLDVNAEAAEKEGPGKGGGGALLIEVDFHARQTRHRLNFRPNQDAQFGGKQTQQI